MSFDLLLRSTAFSFIIKKRNFSIKLKYKKKKKNYFYYLISRRKYNILYSKKLHLDNHISTILKKQNEPLNSSLYFFTTLTGLSLTNYDIKQTILSNRPFDNYFESFQINNAESAVINKKQLTTSLNFDCMKNQPNKFNDFFVIQNLFNIFELDRLKIGRKIPIVSFFYNNIDLFYLNKKYLIIKKKIRFDFFNKLFKYLFFFKNDFIFNLFIKYKNLFKKKVFNIFFYIKKILIKFKKEYQNKYVLLTFKNYFSFSFLVNKFKTSYLKKYINLYKTFCRLVWTVKTNNPYLKTNLFFYFNKKYFFKYVKKIFYYSFKYVKNFKKILKKNKKILKKKIKNKIKIFFDKSYFNSKLLNKHLDIYFNSLNIKTIDRNSFILPKHFFIGTMYNHMSWYYYYTMYAANFKFKYLCSFNLDNVGKFFKYSWFKKNYVNKKNKYKLLSLKLKNKYLFFFMYEYLFFNNIYNKNSTLSNLFLNNNSFFLNNYSFFLMDTLNFFEFLLIDTDNRAFFNLCTVSKKYKRKYFFFNILNINYYNFFNVNNNFVFKIFNDYPSYFLSNLNFNLICLKKLNIDNSFSFLNKFKYNSYIKNFKYYLYFFKIISYFYKNINRFKYLFIRLLHDNTYTNSLIKTNLKFFIIYSELNFLLLNYYLILLNFISIFIKYKKVF